MADLPLSESAFYSVGFQALVAYTCDNAGTTCWPQWVPIERWSCVMPLELRSRICMLVELINTVNSDTYRLDNLYVVQFPHPGGLFVAFKGCSPEPLEEVIDTLMHRQTQKAAREAAGCAKIPRSPRQQCLWSQGFCLTCSKWGSAHNIDLDYDSDDLPDLI
ncbi:hypothetical protein B0H16DRAFT_1561382 [Mycena metata]|uniref:Uncharacterized protein n=1 Tax=Mycena metata TaxID=1033252 RepID=A0AAD7IHP4_9AGAR|nr:hypothetical protein B0H16DRAFT_1561382 [Mycena metata]